MDSLFDVIIVGGGPAGSMTAYRLANAGLKTLLLEAKTFPREKPCGGGVQEKAAKKIPFDWSAVKRGSLHGLSFSFNFADRFRRTYPEALVHSVLRTEFDELLLSNAKRAGATVMENVKATKVANENGMGLVETSSGVLRARFVVGADGANGISRITLNERSDYHWQSGLYCEVPEEHVRPESIDYDCMRVDWGTLPSGYAWIFPKKDFVNIGVGVPNAIGRMARDYLSKFLEYEQVLRPGSLEKLAFRGHQLPTMTDRTKMVAGAILLVGDAAGLIEPFTGDGISYALHSAEIASEVISGAFESKLSDLAEYEHRVRSEIGAEIIWSQKLRSFFVTFPHMIHDVFRRNDKVWAAFCRVLRGEESFRVFRRKKLGVFEFLWAPIDGFTDWYEKRRLANPTDFDDPLARTAGKVMGAVLKRI